MKTLESLEEKLILKRIKNGEKEAFTEVYDFYVVKIYRFVYLKIGSRETAEDLTADVFLKCWRFLKNNGEEKNNLQFGFKEGKLGSFLYKIARNLIVDFYRKKQFRTVEISEEAKNIIPDHRQDLLSKIVLKQEIEELMESLKRLKDEYRDVLILRYVEDFSIKEISEVMEKPDGTVRVLLHRAIKSLKKEMRAENESL